MNEGGLSHDRSWRIRYLNEDWSWCIFLVWFGSFVVAVQAVVMKGFGALGVFWCLSRILPWQYGK
jgi:hypothetical protein